MIGTWLDLRLELVDLVAFGFTVVFGPSGAGLLNGFPWDSGTSSDFILIGGNELPCTGVDIGLDGLDPLDAVDDAFPLAIDKLAPGVMGFGCTLPLGATLDAAGAAGKRLSLPLVIIAVRPPAGATGVTAGFLWKDSAVSPGRLRFRRAADLGD